jgi:hypothetical protein
MLAPDEEAAVAEQFGVAHTQVRRDHLISRLLAALGAHVASQVVFFGGTARGKRQLIKGGDELALAVGNGWLAAAARVALV